MVAEQDRPRHDRLPISPWSQYCGQRTGIPAWTGVASPVPIRVSNLQGAHMNLKRRGHRVSLYRSIWVPKGPDVPHGYSHQTFVGSIATDATSIPTELAARLTPDECNAVEQKILAPAALAREAACRQFKQREADPAWRLDEALRLVNEAVERSQALPVLTTRPQSLKAAADRLKTLGCASAAAQATTPADPLREALRVIVTASEAVRQGRYGRGPLSGFRKTAVFRQWTEILAAVDGGERSLLRALQDAGFATRRKH